MKTIDCERTHLHYIDLANRHAAGKRVLDAPAGVGMISRGMRERGFEVTPADIFPESFGVPGMECVKIDLDARLPFEDASFDVILCREGIEHVESQFHTIREFHRILAPGGKLLVSTPNVLCLRSRLAHLMIGGETFRFRPPIDEWDCEGSDHINLHTYYTLRAGLRRNGFSIGEVTTFRYSWTSVALMPLVPFVGFFTWKALRRHKIPRQKAPNREIRNHVLSRDLLFGKKLIVVAEKEA